jgi:hypothetical protein
MIKMQAYRGQVIYPLLHELVTTKNPAQVNEKLKNLKYIINRSLHSAAE